MDDSADIPIKVQLMLCNLNEGELGTIISMALTGQSMAMTDMAGVMGGLMELEAIPAETRLSALRKMLEITNYYSALEELNHDRH